MSQAYRVGELRRCEEVRLHAPVVGLTALRLAALQIDADPLCATDDSIVGSSGSSSAQDCGARSMCSAAHSIGSDSGGSSGGGGSGLGKRKTTAAPRAHWGLSSDGSARLALIALSRLLRTQDEGMLAHAAASPIGAALLDALRAAVLRVAVAAGGAHPGLSATSVETLFNMSGSTFASQARYDSSSLTLPSRLPFGSAKALIRALLDSLAAALFVAEGGTLVGLLRVLPPRPLDQAAQAAVAALVATVEADATRRLLLASAGGSSSSSSTRSAQPGPPPPPPLPMPVEPQPHLPPPPSAPTLDVSISLLSNARRLVQARLGRPMTQPEIEALEAGLVEALSVLRVGTDEAHRTTLQSITLTVLSTPAGAQLWACLLEEAERTIQSVAGFVAAVVGAASAIASAQLTAALGL